METPVVDQRKRVRSPAQLARQKAKEASHKERMGQLEGEIQGILNANLATEPIMEGRIRTKEMIEHALQNKFGQTVRVESIGLDRLGLHLGQAPLELAVVDSNGDALAPPDAGNTLYQPLALIDALRSSGISARLYSTPNWISSESASRSFALPEPTIINEDMSFILVPPDPSHSLRSSLVEDCIAKCPSMRNVLGLLYIFAARDTETTLPPLASRILSHLTMAYYRYRYGTLAPSNASKSVPILSFYCHPSSTISPDGSHDVSSDVQEPIMVSVSQPSDFSPSRKATSTVASELLDLLRWWDQLRWDHHVIVSTSLLPLPRTFDNGSDSVRTWDWRHAALIVQDPIYPLNNLATLLAPTSYAELRTSFRSIQRSLRAGLGTSIARREAQLLRPLSTHNTAVRSLSTTAEKNYGDYLTENMLELYKLTRPTPEVQRHREQTIAELKRILTNRFGPQYVPALFGSSRYGVSDRQSDLDIVILDQDHPHGFTPTVYDRTLPALYKLSDLAQLLRKKRYGKVIVIPAKVPIIKARDPKTNLQIDININDRLGLFNTELLEHYCTFWPPLSNLIYVIKKWAKVRGLNKPAGLKKAGPTFSSYCLTLMIVGFLQSRGILPNLHEQRPTNQQDRPYFWIKINKNSRMKCWVDWNHLSPSAWTPANNPSLGRAFYAWLHYFAHDHKYDEFAIRIAEGGVVPRHGKTKAPKGKSKTPQGETEKDTAGPSDALDQTSDVEHAMEVEAITDDLEPAELEAVADEARAMQDADAELEESLVDDTFIRASRFEEPTIWTMQGLVVGDPFITSKNCAANVSRKSLIDFKNECKNSLEAMDAGMSLRWLLSGARFLGVNEEKEYQKAVESRVNTPKPKQKKPRAAGGTGPPPQRSQQSPPQQHLGPDTGGVAK